MAILREKSAHLWERDEYDWYVEPIECSLALFDAVDIPGPVWDPAVGSGRILDAAGQFGKKTIGSDIVCRSSHCAVTKDFFDADYIHDFCSIVSNPPFRVAEDFVRLAIERTPVSGAIAMLLPLVWMAGFSTKRDWLPKSPLREVLPISPRPSMPPGAVIEAGEKPGNGTKDFGWFVWQVGYAGVPRIRFLNTTKFKPISKRVTVKQMEFGL